MIRALLVSRYRQILMFSVIAVIISCAWFRLECLALGKDIFRLARSEVHLAIFNFQWARAGEITAVRPLITPQSSGLLFIAHGTGQVNGVPARNSLQGFDASFNRGCRFIEADFEWTHDGYLVSTHDWFSFFGEPLHRTPDIHEFTRRLRVDGFNQMTFDDIDAWLIRHPSIRLVTDVKANNPAALKLFRYSKSFQQIIPQIYTYMEFLAAKQLGFLDVILTTYMTYYSESTLRRFAKIAHPSAVTVPDFRLTPELIAMMAQLNVPVFTHPVPYRSDLEKLPKGIKGIYSSTLCE